MANTANEQKKPGFFPVAIVKAVALRLVLGLFFVSAIMVLLISVVVNSQTNRHVRMITESTQNHLRAAAMAASKYVSAEELDRYHTIEDTDIPEYQDLKNRLIQFAEEYNVLYVYYWREYGNGTGQHIVDNDTDPEEQVGPWNIFELEEVALDGLAGNVGVTDLGTYTADEWGGLISGYAPVYDEDSNFYCVAGVDISDEPIFIQRRDSRNMTNLQIIALSVSVIFGVLNMLLYRRKARQIEEAHVKLQYFNNNLRRAFSTYLSEDVVEEIVSDPTRLQLGGISRYMTAMFTDVQGFTRIAEMLSPEYLVDLLNYYLSSMSDIILEQKGTIDKYEGDAIISFFGAPLELPNHADAACAAAIAMKRIETEMNKYILENGISPSPMLTRIGINSGEMVVGNMGTEKKMNYTIISNAVNMASRLEGVNKQYGTWIIASENTVKETGNRFLCRRLDKIRVVGINEPVRIFEILEEKDHASSALNEKTTLFHNAHGLFEARRWVDAERGFNNVLNLFPGDGPSILYIDRCRQYQNHEPVDGWDGVFDMIEK
jgi:class 3 adenylate cyclase